jgi:hypothetical protein
MKAPSDKARLVLERYKAAMGPAGADKARLLEVIQRRAAAGDLPRFEIQTTTPAVPKASFVQRFWASSFGKAGLALVIVAPALGIYAAHRTRSGPTTQQAPLPMSQRETALAPASPAVSGVAPQPAPDQTTPTTAGSVPHAQTDKPNDALVPSEPTVDEEVKLMNRAQAALRSGNPSQALQLLNEDARRFPNGKLASARAVAHMIALCRLGRASEARVEADRFLVKNPSSPFAARVSDVCSSSRENR